jgi:hypothetical protein
VESKKYNSEVIRSKYKKERNYEQAYQSKSDSNNDFSDNERGGISDDEKVECELKEKEKETTDFEQNIISAKRRSNTKLCV